MATATTTRRGSDAGDREISDVFDLDTPGGGSQSRWPEIGAGLFVVAVFALAGAWFYANTNDRVAVIAARNTIERGDVVTVDDLRVVQVDSDDQLNLLGRDESGLIVGRVALTDLAPGTLVTPEQFAASGLIESGEGIVGLALDPGEYPSLSIRPGDLVSVVHVPRASDSATPEELILVEEALVVDVGGIGVQNQLFISLSTSRASAGEIAAAAAQDRVRLIQVGAE